MDGTRRPMLVKLLRYRDKLQIKSNAKLLKGTNIFINDDMTLEERQKEGSLRKKKRELQNENPKIVCSIRHGRLYVNDGNSKTTLEADVGSGSNSQFNIGTGRNISS